MEKDGGFSSDDTGATNPTHVRRKQPQAGFSRRETAAFPASACPSENQAALGVREPEKQADQPHSAVHPVSTADSDAHFLPSHLDIHHE